MEFLTGLLGNLFSVFILLAFIALVLLLEGLYLTWNAYKGPEAKKIEQPPACDVGWRKRWGGGVYPQATAPE